MLQRLVSYFGIALVILLIFDFGSKMISDSQSNPIDNEGKIKEGQTVDFETEKKLSDESIKLADEYQEEELTSQFIYTFNFCLSTAKETGSYECIYNLIEPSVRATITKETEPNSAGQAIYQYLVNYQTLTGVKVFDRVTEGDVFSYELDVHVLEELLPYKYKLSLKENKISSIELID